MEEDYKRQIDNRLEQLCKGMGQALWEVQGVEQLLAKYYAIVFELSDNPSLEEIDEAFENNFVYTAGRLVNKLKTSSRESSIDQSLLDTFVKERNWLAHKIRRLDFTSLYDEVKFIELIDRVIAIEQESSKLIDIFHNLMIEYFVSIGVPRDYIDKIIKQELSRLYGS